MVRAEPVYEGFKKVGERFFCLHCGQCYPSEAETPFIRQGDTRPKIFTEADKPDRLNIFSDEERQHSCGWCRHFVVNPFTQRCGLTNAFTEAERQTGYAASAVSTNETHDLAMPAEGQMAERIAPQDFESLRANYSYRREFFID